MIVQVGLAVIKFLSVFFFFFWPEILCLVSSFINSDGEINTRRKNNVFLDMMTITFWQREASY